MIETLQTGHCLKRIAKHIQQQCTALHLYFSCLCAERVPVAPAVGAVLHCLCLVPWWHRLRCDVLARCMYRGLSGGLLLAARAVLLGWRFFCVCAFSGFLL